MANDSLEIEQPEIVRRLRDFLLWYSIVCGVLGLPLILSSGAIFFVDFQAALYFLGIGVGGIYFWVVAWAMTQARRALEHGEPDAPRLARVSLVAAIPGALATLTGSLIMGYSALVVLQETWFGLIFVFLSLLVLAGSAGVLDLVAKMLRSQELDTQIWSEVEPDGDELVVFDLDGVASDESVEQTASSYRGL